MRLLALRFAWWAVVLAGIAGSSLSRADPPFPGPTGTPPSRADVVTRLSTLSVPFVEAGAVADAPLAYLARLPGGTFAVARDGSLLYAFPNGRITERFAGGTAAPRATTPLPGRVSSFIGNDPSRHATSLATFERISLGEVFPHIDVTLRATGSNVEKIFTVGPQGDPARIRVSVDGARVLRVLDDGALAVVTAEGELRFTPPIAFQESNGRRTDVAVSYALAEGTSYRFDVGAYDRAVPLIIDPLLQASYLGGSNQELGIGVAVHPATGDIIVAGKTESANLPCTTAGNGCAAGPQIALSGTSDGFVARFSADLTQLKQTTYLGGSDTDELIAIAIHPTSGDVIVAGQTSSTNFPCTTANGICLNGPQPARAGSGFDNDGVLARLSADLTQLKQATYFGGSLYDGVWAMAINPLNGEIIVVGATASTNLPCTNAAVGNCPNGYQNTHFSPGNGFDGFVARFSADLLQLRQATYLGGESTDHMYAVAVNPFRNEIVVAGGTDSDGWDCMEPSHNCAGGAQIMHGGVTDGFIGRLSADLTQLFGMTYLGGSGTDLIRAVAVDPFTGDVVVAGYTQGGVPCAARAAGCLAGAQPSYAGGTGYDAFVSRLSGDLSQFRQTTYLGGTNQDYASALLIHPANGQIYVAGTTYSSNFPCRTAAGTCATGAQSVLGGSADGFVAAFAPSLRHLVQSTYFGGTGLDSLRAIALHPSTGEIVVAGEGQANVPCTSTATAGCANGGQPAHAGDFDAIVARFSPDLTNADATPAAFTIPPVNNAAVSTLIASAPVQVSGLFGPTRIYAEGAIGTAYCVSSTNACTCDVNGGFQTSPGLLSNNQYVCVRHISASIPNALTESMVHVGGGAAVFRVATGALLALNNCKLDVDGNDILDALTDGLLLLRAMFGLTGSAVTNSAVAQGAPRNTWALIRAYLNANCGGNFAP